MKASTADDNTITLLDGRVPLQPETVLNGFEIIEQLADGGTGIIYRAKKENTYYIIKEFYPIKDNISIGTELIRSGSKLLPLDINDTRFFVDIFNEDADKEVAISDMICKSAKDNNILGFLSEKKLEISIDDADFASTVAVYTVMETYAGNTLRNYHFMTSGTELLKDKICMIIKVLDALALFHNNNILHLDITPNNIYICFGFNETSNPFPVLIDYGSAFREGDDASFFPSTSIGFSAPELWSFSSLHDIGRASDIYSVGAVLYRLLFGHDPLPRWRLDYNSPENEVRNELEKCEDIPKSIIEPLTGVIAKSIATYKEKRYQSCEEMKTALQKICDILDKRCVHGAVILENAKARLEDNKELIDALYPDVDFLKN